MKILTDEESTVALWSMVMSLNERVNKLEIQIRCNHLFKMEDDYKKRVCIYCKQDQEIT